MTLTGLSYQTRNTPRLVVSISAEEAATVLALQGDADLTALPFLVDMISGVIADRQGAIVIDLAETEAIDAACVRAVGLASRSLADNGRQITFRSPSHLALMLLATFGLASLVEPDDGAAR